MSALNKIISEMTDEYWDPYDDSETVWGKPANTLTFGDYRRAKAELAALREQLAKAEAERDALKDLLRETEFSQHDDVRDDYFCEFCHGYQETGHSKSCKLQAALKGDA